MSGGSYGYAFEKLNDFAEALESERHGILYLPNETLTH